MKKLTNENSKDNQAQNQNNINPIEDTSNEKANKETYKNSKEIVSMKNNSGRFVFTLNGENEKSEKKWAQTLSSAPKISQSKSHVAVEKNKQCCGK